MDKDNPQNTPTPNPDEELKNAIETSFAPQEEVSETPEITPADEAPAEAPAPEMPVEAEPAPAPTPAPEPITPEPETLSPVGDNIAYPAKKPRSKSTLILLSILAVVIIGAGTTLAIWLSQGGSIGNLIPNTQNNQDTNEQTETPLTAQVVVDNVRTALNNQHVTAFDDTVITEGTEGPSIKLDGYDFYMADKGVSLAIEIKREATNERAQATELARQVVDSSLTDEGLAVTDGVVADMARAPLTYQNESIVCVYNDLIHPMYLSCANKDGYKSVAETIKPFADIYATANPNQSLDNLVLRNPTITDSMNDGYQRAEIAVSPMSPVSGGGGFAALFYGVTGTWKHFVNTQSILSCDRYDTEELRLAYEGEKCYDETTESMEVTVTRSES